MTVEVRQLVIKSTIGDERKPDAQGKEKERPLTEDLLARLKEDLLADCKAWLTEKLDGARER
jgi:hypothetical protein